MSDQYPEWLEVSLKNLPLAEVRFFKSIGSTNDYCLNWVGEGARDYSLVVADHQSHGRGRENRKWVTNAGAALAFSIIFRPFDSEKILLHLFSPLGAIAIRRALEELFELHAEIKWPNDVLVSRKKLAGILVENVWDGVDLKAIVMGIGLNVTPSAIPPATELLFPATCVESEAGRQVNRWQLLAAIISRIIMWRKKMGADIFFSEWSSYLAFKGERVCISGKFAADFFGKLIDLDHSGNLMIEADNGQKISVTIGDVHLRAV